MSSSQNSNSKHTIPSPPVTPDEPDADTLKSPDLSQDRRAGGRIFHFDRWGIRYGTDDKQHFAAMVLGVAVLLLLLICLFIGAVVSDRSWIVEIAKILGNAFLFVAGVAIGSSKKGK